MAKRSPRQMYKSYPVNSLDDLRNLYENKAADFDVLDLPGDHVMVTVLDSGETFVITTDKFRAGGVRPTREKLYSTMKADTPKDNAIRAVLAANRKTIFTVIAI